MGSTAPRGSGRRRAAAGPPNRHRPTQRSPTGNRVPTSPSPAAPRSASMTAWSAASPSEWPTRPRGSSGNARPPRCRGRPASSRWASNPTPARTKPRSPVSAALEGACAGAARARRSARRSGRSSGWVSLRLAGSPATATTGTLMAARAAASSVGSSPCAFAASSAARRIPRVAACGVCAAPMSVRSTVSSTTPSRTRFRVSCTLTTGIAPAPAVAAAATLVMSVVVAAGRAASWTRTTVASPTPASVNAVRPARTESARAAPPATSRHRSTAPAGITAANRSTASGGTTTATTPIPGTASRASRLHRQMARPKASCQSLSTSVPIRRPRPAATSTPASRGSGSLMPPRAAGRRSCGPPPSGGRGSR